ncbi:hypothetical protein HOE22_03445 [Candidatus Woesearchaeota archaeon]|nr:hypothetical protein [bacterium]MBT4207379.1 hypothetical protein [Candidatus Woesearchaeota archaeon]MBT4731488.1 hypothetical protein [Candidatus Woesearchaeota archaeon]
MRNWRIVLVASVILAIGVTAYFNKPAQVSAEVNLEKLNVLKGDIRQVLDGMPLVLDKYLQLLDNDPSLTAEEKISMIEKNILAKLNCDN